MLLKPEPKPLQLHGGGKTFVKGGITVDIENSVGQLVEHQGDHAVIRQGGEPGMQWIIEPAQGGVGGNSADKGIVIALMEGRLFLPGIGQAEVPAIGLAAHKRITPLVGGKGKLRHGDQIHYHPWAAQSYVFTEDVVHGQGQFLSRKRPRLRCQLKLSTKFRVGFRCRDHLVDGPGLHHQGHMAADGLAIVANGRTATQGCYQ